MSPGVAVGLIRARTAALVASGFDVRRGAPGSAAVVVPPGERGDVLARSGAQIFYWGHICHMGSMVGTYQSPKGKEVSKASELRRENRTASLLGVFPQRLRGKW
jgi:hypothetical protein